MSDHPVEALLRPPVELWSSLTSFAVGGIAMAAPWALMMPPGIAYATGTTLFAFGAYRGQQAWRVIRYQRHMRRLPEYALSSRRIPLSHHKLFLGRGFRWTQLHTQRLRDTLKPEVRRYVEPGRLYRWARQKEVAWEHGPLLSLVARALRSRSRFNLLAPMPPVGGMPLGIPVMVLWYFYPVWWLLPTFGLLIGYITNKIALYMIQKPFEPVKFGPFSFQGLFIKRQKEVSAEYGKLFAKDLVTSENILNAVMRNGKSSDKLLQLVERVVNEEVGKAQGNYRPLVAFSTGTTEYDKIRERICDHIFEELGQPDRRSFEYVDRTLDIEATLTERVGNLPPEEFFNLIHPVVAEDEWKLIMVGAVLGFFAGTLQWALLT